VCKDLLGYITRRWSARCLRNVCIYNRNFHGALFSTALMRLNVKTDSRSNWEMIERPIRQTAAMYENIRAEAAALDEAKSAFKIPSGNFTNHLRHPELINAACR
jgi:hypothetical protein